MMMTYINRATGILLVFSFFVIQVAGVYASPQSAGPSLEPSSDNPHVNSSVSSPLVQSLGVAMPGGNTTNSTPLDDASVMGNQPNAYTWRLNLSGICSGAQLQSLRIITQTSATNEEPTSGLFLGVYGSNDLTMLDSYSINSGLGDDSDPWISPMFGFSSPTIDRGTSGTTGPYTTFPANLGMNGTLDATWDLTGLNTQDPIGIFIQHWLSSGTTTAQTTIQSATVTYDDAACTINTSTTTSQPSATLASTGQSLFSIYAIVTALVLPAIIFATGRKAER